MGSQLAPVVVVVALLVGAGALAAWTAGLGGGRADLAAAAGLGVGAALALAGYFLAARVAWRRLAVAALGVNGAGLLLVLTFTLA